MDLFSVRSVCLKKNDPLLLLGVLGRKLTKEKGKFLLGLLIKNLSGPGKRKSKC
jgi:hypothetical protein